MVVSREERIVMREFINNSNFKLMIYKVIPIIFSSIVQDGLDKFRIRMGIVSRIVIKYNSTLIILH